MIIMMAARLLLPRASAFMGVDFVSVPFPTPTRGISAFSQRKAMVSEPKTDRGSAKSQGESKTKERNEGDCEFR